MSQVVRSAIASVLVLVLTLGLIFWMSGMFEHKIEPGVMPASASRAPADAVVAEVVREVIPVLEEAAGTVVAERKTTVSSRILAAIRSIEANAGDSVERGQVLVRLEDDDLRAQVAEARRAVEAATAARDRRANDFARARRLLDTGVISQSEFDRAEESARVAAAELEGAEERQRTAEINLTYAEILSPVSGRVVDRFADPGDTATPGTPLLSLYDPSALRLEVPVRESLVSELRVGDRLEVRLGPDGRLPMEGTIDEIVPQAEAGSRTFLVKVGLPKRAGVYTGGFGRVLIPAGERARLLIPTTAVERIGQLAFVTTVDGGGKLRRRLVNLGPETIDGRSEVLSGLRAGEMVVVE